MNTLTSVFLGIIQGLTEFIPVSSSGHLVIAQKLLPGFSQPGVLFDVILHLGTLFAVFVYFRKKIMSVIKDFKYLTALFVGTLPAVVIGFLFKDFLESTYTLSGVILGVQFLVTSVICFLTDRFSGKRKEIEVKDSLYIGFSQAVSILPAISRSGATIFTAVARGIDAGEAARYSFLLSIPAILGANLLQIVSYKEELFPLPVEYVWGFVASFFTGLISIYLTIKLLDKKMFKVFALYTLLLGIIVMFI